MRPFLVPLAFHIFSTATSSYGLEFQAIQTPLESKEHATTFKAEDLSAVLGCGCKAWHSMAMPGRKEDGQNEPFGCAFQMGILPSSNSKEIPSGYD